MTASQRRPISRRTRACVLLALLATTSATLSACGGDRASDKSTTLTSVVGDQAKAKYKIAASADVPAPKNPATRPIHPAAAATRRIKARSPNEPDK